MESGGLDAGQQVIHRVDLSASGTFFLLDSVVTMACSLAKLKLHLGFLLVCPSILFQCLCMHDTLVHYCLLAWMSKGFYYASSGICMMT